MCPAGGHLFAEARWLLAAVPTDEGVGSCDTACGSIGLPCDEEKLQAVGSGGTEESWRNALDQADPLGAPPPISSTSPHMIACGLATDYAVGCSYAFGLEPEEINGSIRRVHQDSGTLCGADYVGGFCATPAVPVCACSLEE